MNKISAESKKQGKREIMFYSIMFHCCADDNEIFIHACAEYLAHVGEHFSYLPFCRLNINVVFLVGARHKTDARLLVKFKNGLGDYNSLVFF